MSASKRLRDLQAKRLRDLQANADRCFSNRLRDLQANADRCFSNRLRDLQANADMLAELRVAVTNLAMAHMGIIKEATIVKEVPK